MEKKPIAIWTGYADDDEVRDYMESHNEDAEDGDKWDMEDARETLNGDSEYWNSQWEYFTEYLTELMKGRTVWRDDAKEMGWTKASGYREFEADNGADLLRAISPNTDCSYRIYKHRNGFKVILSHHDAPMGEIHIIKPIKKI